MALLNLDGHQRLSVVFFTFTLTIVAGILGWMVFEKSPLKYKNVPFEMAANEFQAGQIPAYRVVRCNNTRETIVYSIHQKLHYLNEDVIISLGKTKLVLEPGCSSAMAYLSPLPKNLLPGYYRIIGESEVQGDLRAHFEEWSTQPFLVTR